jgi:hypothetical protein
MGSLHDEPWECSWHFILFFFGRNPSALLQVCVLFVCRALRRGRVCRAPAKVSAATWFTVHHTLIAYRRAPLWRAGKRRNGFSFDKDLAGLTTFSQPLIFAHFQPLQAQAM